MVPNFSKVEITLALSSRELNGMLVGVSFEGRLVRGESCLFAFGLVYACKE